jgi:sigma-B regulation protein RsbU (phosphoserine phosphatase)
MKEGARENCHFLCGCKEMRIIDRKKMPKIGIMTKILIAFLGLFIISFGLLGYIAFNNIKGVGDYTLQSSASLGGSAVNDSAEALESQAEEYLLRLANDQADISNTVFEKVEAEVNVMANFASALWSNPTSFGYRHSYSQKEDPDDIYATSVYVLAPDVAVDAVREELNLSSNLDNIFIPIYANDPNLAWIYIGTESGIMRVYPWCSGVDPSFDHRVRGWYERAKETSEIGWSEPLVDAGTGRLMVVCSKPVYSTDNLIGVIGADVSIETINQQIINTQIGELGYAFLIDNNGKVVARPGLSGGDKSWDESFETENLLLSDNPELRKIAENMTTGNTGIAKCSFEDGEKYIAYAPVTCANWSVGIVMSVEEIIAPALTTKREIIAATHDTDEHINRQINNMQKSFTVIFIIILLAVFGIILLLSRLITKPILTLKKGSEVIGGGDLDYRVEVKTGDELEELANSFNKMASDLKGYTKELVEKETRIKELEIERLERYSKNLERKVKMLEITINREKTKKAVSEITETEYFKKLREEATDIREKRGKA